MLVVFAKRYDGNICCTGGSLGSFPAQWMQTCRRSSSERRTPGGCGHWRLNPLNTVSYINVNSTSEYSSSCSLWNFRTLYNWGDKFEKQMQVCSSAVPTHLAPPQPEEDFSELVVGEPKAVNQFSPSFPSFLHASTGVCRVKRRPQGRLCSSLHIIFIGRTKHLSR